MQKIIHVLLLAAGLLALPAPALAQDGAGDVLASGTAVPEAEPAAVTEPLGTVEQLVIGGVVLTGAFTIGMIATGSLATGLGVASAVAISYAFLP